MSVKICKDIGVGKDKDGEFLHLYLYKDKTSVHPTAKIRLDGIEAKRLLNMLREELKACRL